MFTAMPMNVKAFIEIVFRAFMADMLTVPAQNAKDGTSTKVSKGFDMTVKPWPIKYRDGTDNAVS